ncbi:Hypothetical predicted protein, partial [Pelobates cultripes]
MADATASTTRDSAPESETLKRLDAIFKVFWRKIKARQATAGELAGNLLLVLPSHAHLKKSSSSKEACWKMALRQAPLPTNKQTNATSRPSPSHRSTQATR